MFAGRRSGSPARTVTVRRRTVSRTRARAAGDARDGSRAGFADLPAAARGRRAVAADDPGRRPRRGAWCGRTAAARWGGGRRSARRRSARCRLRRELDDAAAGVDRRAERDLRRARERVAAHANRPADPRSGDVERREVQREADVVDVAVVEVAAGAERREPDRRSCASRAGPGPVAERGSSVVCARRSADGRRRQRRGGERVAAGVDRRRGHGRRVLLVLVAADQRRQRERHAAGVDLARRGRDVDALGRGARRGVRAAGEEVGAAGPTRALRRRREAEVVAVGQRR